MDKEKQNDRQYGDMYRIPSEIWNISHAQDANASYMLGVIRVDVWVGMNGENLGYV